MAAWRTQKQQNLLQTWTISGSKPQLLSVIFQYMYWFRFRMKMCLINSSLRQWNAMIFTKGLSVCIWYCCQTSCVKFKTARKSPRIPNPASCEPRTCLRASPGGGVLVSLWWFSSVEPERTHRTIMLCAGSSWNAVMIPGPLWIQGNAVVFVYQSLFHCFIWPPNCEKALYSVCVGHSSMNKGAVFSTQHKHWLSSLKK